MTIFKLTISKEVNRAGHIFEEVVNTYYCVSYGLAERLGNKLTTGKETIYFRIMEVELLTTIPGER